MKPAIKKIVLLYSLALLFVISCYFQQEFLAGLLGGFILGFTFNEAFFVNTLNVRFKEGGQLKLPTYDFEENP